jgi:hypothetical protein
MSYNFIKTYKKTLNNEDFDLDKVIKYFPPASKQTENFKGSYELILKTARKSDDDISEINPNLDFDEIVIDKKTKEKLKTIHLNNLLMISFFYTSLSHDFYKKIFYDVEDLGNGYFKVLKVHDNPKIYHAMLTELKILKQLITIDFNKLENLEVRFWPKKDFEKLSKTQSTVTEGIAIIDIEDSKKILNFSILTIKNKIKELLKQVRLLEDIYSDNLEELLDAEEINSLIDYLEIFSSPTHVSETFRGELVHILTEYIKHELGIRSEKDKYIDLKKEEILIIYPLVSAFDMIDEKFVKVKRTDKINASYIRKSFNSEVTNKFLKVRLKK